MKRLVPFILTIAVIFSTAAPPAHAAIEHDKLPVVLLPMGTEIPAKFKFSRPETAELQAQLFQEFGILAVNGSDEHSAQVLSGFLFLLRKAFTPKAIRGLKHLRYLYAYRGHDAHHNMAAFHLKAKAISIGGIGAYPETTEKMNVQLLATLAHEIGHAFLFERISHEELQKISDAYGSWGPVFSKKAPDNLMSSLFFMPHPHFRDSRHQDPKSPHNSQWKASNLTSGYATTNIHEWFADAFASVVMRKLGQRNLLGESWEEKLIVRPNKPKDYWVNYNNSSNEFSAWLEAKAANTFQ